MGDHRIQVRLDDEAWARANWATAKNGLRAVSKLCEMLLDQEYARLGIEKEKPPPLPGEGTDDEEEHRIQVRATDAEWQHAQQIAAWRGLTTVSDLCRTLLDEEFERFESASKAMAETKPGKTKARKVPSGHK